MCLIGREVQLHGTNPGESTHDSQGDHHEDPEQREVDDERRSTEQDQKILQRMCRLGYHTKDRY